MEYRQLGNSGLKVSALAMGTMTFGGKGNFAKVGNLGLKDVRRLIETPQGSEPMLPFLETHPLIRDLDHYAQFLAQFE